MRYSLAILVALTAASAASCRSALEPDSLAFAVTIDRSTVAADENVRITVIAQNFGAQPISLGPRCVPVAFRVYSAAGESVGPAAGWEARFSCIGQIDNSIPPRGERRYTFLWAPIANYGVATKRDPLPLGRYTVLAGLPKDEMLRSASAPAYLEVVAPE